MKNIGGEASITWSSHPKFIAIEKEAKRKEGK